jgi:Mg2+ and Co2+ transporter CorA
MEHAEALRDDLTFIDRMIAECQQHIVRLKKTSAEMSRDGQDTDLARDVLASFAAALTRHEAQRKLIVTLMQRDSDQHAEPRPARARTRNKKLQNA